MSNLKHRGNLNGGYHIQKLNYLIKNPTLVKQTRREERRYIIKKYYQNKIYDNLIKIFRILIEKKQLSERTGCLIPEHCKSKEQQLIYLRCLFAYEYAQKIYDGGEALDIGCGDGYGTYFLSKRADKVIGVDINRELINHCRIKYKRNNLKFALYNGKKLPFKDNYFSLITCFHVIEHVKRDGHFLKELKRVLKEGGIALISTPYRCYRLKRGQTPWNKFHVREYYPFQFRNLLKGIFPNVKLSGITGNDLVRKIEYKRVGHYKNLRLDTNRNFGINDFFIIEKNLRSSLDLLGICKKNKNIKVKSGL